MLAKGVAKENVSVQISEQQLRVVLLGPVGEEEFDLDVQLWDKVGTWGRPWFECWVPGIDLQGWVKASRSRHCLCVGCSPVMPAPL